MISQNIIKTDLIEYGPEVEKIIKKYEEEFFNKFYIIIKNFYREYSFFIKRIKKYGNVWVPNFRPYKFGNEDPYQYYQDLNDYLKQNNSRRLDQAIRKRQKEIKKKEEEEEERKKKEEELKEKMKEGKNDEEWAKIEEELKKKYDNGEITRGQYISDLVHKKRSFFIHKINK